LYQYKHHTVITLYLFKKPSSTPLLVQVRVFTLSMERITSTPMTPRFCSMRSQHRRKVEHSKMLVSESDWSSISHLYSKGMILNWLDYK